MKRSGYIVIQYRLFGPIFDPCYISPDSPFKVSADIILRELAQFRLISPLKGLYRQKILGKLAQFRLISYLSGVTDKDVLYYWRRHFYVCLYGSA
jgi:hypothetical protein